MHTPEGPAWASRVVWGFLWGPMCLSFWFWFLLMCGAYRSSLWFCLLVFASCFCCFDFLLSALYRFCFLLSASCFLLSVSCFCFLLFAFLLLCVLDRKQHGCNKTIDITTATITMTLTKESHYSNLYSILLLLILVRVQLSRVIFLLLMNEHQETTTDSHVTPQSSSASLIGISEPRRP